MAIYCYFFKYDSDAKAFKFWTETHGIEETGIARLQQDSKEMYVERRFATPQTDIDAIAKEVNRKYQDNTYFRCKECGKVVYLTPDQEWWFKEKGFDLPKRCYDCRIHRRAAKKIKDEDSMIS